MQVLIKLRAVPSPIVMITNLVGAGENCCVHNYNEELQNANILLFCLFSAPACWRGRQTRPGQGSVNSSHSLLSPLLSSTNTRLMSCSHRHQAYWLPTSRIVLLNCLLIPRRVRWDYDLSIFLWLLNVQKGCKNYLTLWCSLTVWLTDCLRKIVLLLKLESAELFWQNKQPGNW